MPLLFFVQRYYKKLRSPNLHFALFLQILTILHSILPSNTLQKVRFLQVLFFTPKIEMHEKNQGRISELLNYECATKEGCNQYFFENKSS